MSPKQKEDVVAVLPVLPEFSMAFLIQQGLSAGRFRRNRSAFTRLVFQGGRGHATVEVDLRKQEVDLRLDGAEEPYAIWPIAEFLALTKAQLDEVYL
jgi:hypothetical protein